MLFHLRHDTGERLGLELCQMGERLPVELDTGLLGGTDELGVRETERAEAGVDLDVPEAAHVALLVATMREGIGTGMLEGVDGHALLLGAAKAHALGGFEDGTAVFTGVDCFFDAGHGSKLKN